MGRQFRRATKLKKKANYNKRRKDRVNATIKAAGGNNDFGSLRRKGEGACTANTT